MQRLEERCGDRKATEETRNSDGLARSRPQEVHDWSSKDLAWQPPQQIFVPRQKAGDRCLGFNAGDYTFSILVGNVCGNRLLPAVRTAKTNFVWGVIDEARDGAVGTYG